MAATGAGEAGQSEAWGERAISLAEARAFAETFTSSPSEQSAIAVGLSQFPTDIRVRGLFFDGLARTLVHACGDAVTDEVKRLAGVPQRIVAFNQYPQRDFYKLFYLGARRIHRDAPLPEAMRKVARTFFPVFKTSMLGRTMSALMGEKPETVLPLLAKAYNISVEGNTHEVTSIGPRAFEWRATVEPVPFYDDVFGGIVEGSLVETKTLRIDTIARTPDGPRRRYVFRLKW